MFSMSVIYIFLSIKNSDTLFEAFKKIKMKWAVSTYSQVGPGRPENFIASSGKQNYLTDSFRLVFSIIHGFFSRRYMQILCLYV